jgi:hypothetical protein
VAKRVSGPLVKLDRLGRAAMRSAASVQLPERLNDLVGPMRVLGSSAMRAGWDYRRRPVGGKSPEPALGRHSCPTPVRRTGISSHQSTSEARSRQRSALVTLFGEGTANLQSDSRSRVILLDDRCARAPESGLHVSVKGGLHE